MKRLFMVLMLILSMYALSYAEWIQIAYSIRTAGDPYSTQLVELNNTTTYRIMWGGDARGKSLLIRSSDDEEVYNQNHESVYEDTNITVTTNGMYKWVNERQSGNGSLDMTLWKWSN